MRPRIAAIGARGLLVTVASVCLLLLSVTVAFAGTASAGELLFYPCTSCHPLTPDASTAALPNGFKGHGITLESHDKLGKGNEACLACHDDPSRDPGKLKTVDGFVDVTGDVSLVCYRCHSDKYKQFKAGTHGRHMASCTAAGCHDPHSPSWIYAPPVRPFSGVGFQVRAVSDRTPFTPFASPPLPPATETPAMLPVAAALGVFVILGLVGSIVMGGRRG